MAKLLIRLWMVYKYTQSVRTDAEDEKQVRGVKHSIRNRHKTRQDQTQHKGIQRQTTINAEARNREGNQTDIGEVMTEVIESR